MKRVLDRLEKLESKIDKKDEELDKLRAENKELLRANTQIQLQQLNSGTFKLLQCSNWSRFKQITEPVLDRLDKIEDRIDRKDRQLEELRAENNRLIRANTEMQRSNTGRFIFFYFTLCTN